jgi:RNAse H-fold protein YqgF
MKIMAVDYGEARTGLAMCDALEMLASPLTTIKEKSTEKTIEKIVQAVTENKVEMLVVGHPINMNGTAGERAQKCAQVAEKLKEKLSIPVVLWDERATTKSAQNILSTTGTYGKKRKDVLDAVAATIILENYMAYRKNNQ